MTHQPLFSPLQKSVQRIVRMTIFTAVTLAVAMLIPARLYGPDAVVHAAPSSNTVVDGNARFMVLTPRLIRMEYSDSAQFQDSTTFNVINRTFPIPNYSTQVVDGWREISTDDLTLRYQENSGQFTSNNLVVLLKGQSEPCNFAQGCEAENAALSGGAVINTDHQNYTGSGFVAGYSNQGATTSWAIGGVPTAGDDILTIRYANALGGDGQQKARTLSLYVNGTKSGQLTFPTTADWNTWNTLQQSVHLSGGDDTIALVCDAGDSCNINLDSIALTQGSSSYPTEQPIAVIPDWGQAAAHPCHFSQDCEAEYAALSGGTVVNTDHQNYTGTGFVAGYGKQGATTTWNVHDTSGTDATITVRYANALGGDGQDETRSLSLYVNGNKTGQLSFPTTTNWDTWNNVQQTVQLHSGDNTLALKCDSSDTCNINIDSLTVNEVCEQGQVCQAENAALSGGASVASNHQEFTGTGFVSGYEPSSGTPTTTWTVHSVPQSSDEVLTVRYANYQGSDSQITTRNLDLYVNGSKINQVSLPSTSSWDSWDTVTQTIHLNTGDNTIALACDSGNSCRVNLDSISVVPPNAPVPLMTPANLGGWYRSLDTLSDSVPLHDGLLSRDGWYLIDDSQTALWDGKNWPSPRPTPNGVYQDGYFFGYGHQYQAALRDLAQLTGSSPLLPRWAFGNWYSRYYAYTTSDYEQTLLPKFRSEQVPLDVLVADTDWKSPSQWNGWNWNSNLFPDPQGFLNWAQNQGLHVTLNIHASIQGDDPQFASANSAAGGLIDNGNNNYVWDWGNQAQANSYLGLHQPFDKQGVRFWWLDWCCDNSRVSMPGLNPDGWINHLYAQDATNQGLRGFAFSRMGSSYQGYANDALTDPTGPWSNHRSTVQFTGDTQPTWQMLSFESAFTTAEGNIGQAYVTHDLGSFSGNHLADDLYVRWLQLGAFQPIFRLHSDHGDRLPWDYDDTARIPAEQFMRLRESLVPYLYTLSWQASQTGLPMTRGLYLNYPEDPEAYAFDREYMLGDQILVAPITTPGMTASTQVYLPSGAWTDFFSGKTYTGPSVQTITDDLSAMPVFVKAGGVVPMQPYMDYSGQKNVDPLQLKISAGADGAFTLYEDSGEGMGYQQGQYVQTAISYSQSQSTLIIAAQQGQYSDQLTQRGYGIDISNVTNSPTTVTVNGQSLAQSGSGEGWSYDSGTRTVHITLNARSTSSALSIQLA